jgi:two-component system, NtrC family, nitrogen regulation sensor histidine kinase NtrY
MMRSSLVGRVAAVAALSAVSASCLAVAISSWAGSALIGAVAGVLIALPISWWGARLAAQKWSQVVRAVHDGVLSLRDHDFSISITPVPTGELRELVLAYNSLGDLLRRERLDLHQRELLLDTVIQTTPLVMVLTNAAGRVVYSNIAARQLLHGGRKLEGLDFAALLEQSPAPLREAISAAGDTLFTMEIAAEPHVYHLSQRSFLLNAQSHRLVLLKQLTRELAAQEVRVWKKVIRVIAHELNNSLAPISSLVHSGHLLARELPPYAPAELREARHSLERVFSTIGERTAHLTSFIDGYARFAKLPRPRPAPVSWMGFLQRLEGTTRFRLEQPLPRCNGSFDAAQMEQVMINLLKNAAESGSPQDDITVRVYEEREGFMIEVGDRGSGLSEAVLRDALLPFFSTKPAGTGLGLTLCREIVEAHGGRLSIANRPDGGALVSVWLPSI